MNAQKLFDVERCFTLVEEIRTQTYKGQFFGDFFVTDYLDESVVDLMVSTLTDIFMYCNKDDKCDFLTERVEMDLKRMRQFAHEYRSLKKVYSDLFDLRESILEFWFKNLRFYYSYILECEGVFI